MSTSPYRPGTSLSMDTRSDHGGSSPVHANATFHLLLRLVCIWCRVTEKDKTNPIPIAVTKSIHGESMGTKLHTGPPGSNHRDCYRVDERNTIILLSKFDDVQGGSLGWRWGVHSIPWQKGRVGKSSMLKQIVKGRFEENETTTTEASNYKKTVKVDNTVAVSSLASLNSL